MLLRDQGCLSSMVWTAHTGGILVSFTCPATTPGKCGETINKIAGEIIIPYGCYIFRKANKQHLGSPFLWLKLRFFQMMYGIAVEGWTVITSLYFLPFLCIIIIFKGHLEKAATTKIKT